MDIIGEFTSPPLTNIRPHEKKANTFANKCYGQLGQHRENCGADRPSGNGARLGELYRLWAYDEPVKVATDKDRRPVECIQALCRRPVLRP